MIPRGARAFLVGLPLVTVSVFALGLRLGAPEPARGVRVYVSPAPGGLPPRRVQALVIEEEGLLEKSVPHAEVEASFNGLAWSRWRTNAHGYLEFSAPEEVVGPSIELCVRDPSSRIALAVGTLHPRPAMAPAAKRYPLQYGKREGSLRIEVYAEGSTLAADLVGTLWVRVVEDTGDEGSAGRLERQTTPTEVSLTSDAFLEAPTSTSTDAWGLAHFEVRPVAHHATLTVLATGKRGRGEWSGVLPTSPSAVEARVPAWVLEGRSSRVRMVGPTAASMAYAEVYAWDGLRVWGASVPLDAGEGMLELPSLGTGGYYLATETRAPIYSDPSPGRRVVPFVAASSLADARERAHSAFGAEPRGAPLSFALAGVEIPTFARELALDGLPAARARNDARRLRGLFVCVVGLISGILTELALLSRVLSRSVRESSALEVDAAPTGAIVRLVLPIGAALFGLVMLLAMVWSLG